MNALELIFVLLLVFANGFFVAAEFALVKVRLSQIEQLAQQGNWSAKVATNVLNRLDTYLSACQLGITLASLGLGWAGEDVAKRLLAPLFRSLHIPEGIVDYLAVPIAFGIITFLHITLGEQAPKILAIRTARPMTLFVALPLDLFYRLLWPFIWLLNVSSNLLLRMIGLTDIREKEDSHSADELRLIFAESAAGGELSRRERLMMENVLDLEDKVVRQVMLPRRDIIYLNTRKTFEENLELVSESRHTRFPLCDGELDRVVGMVHTKDLLNAITVEEGTPSLSKMARKLPFFPETMRLDVLLREFQRNRTHVAMVVDEYGTVSGMVTFENVLEELVGPIQDEFDRELPMIIKRAHGRLLVDGMCPVDDLVEEIHLKLPEDITADTTGGLIVELLGHIPEQGEQVRVGEHDFTVVDAEPTRVRRVEVRRVAPIPPPVKPDSKIISKAEAEALRREAESAEPSGRKS